MGDDNIVIEHPLGEQHVQNDSQQDQNLTQNQSDLPNLQNIIQSTKIKCSKPSTLDYSWRSSHPIAIAVGAYVLFTVLAMAAGILIVCLTSRKPENPKCNFWLRPTVSYSSRDSSHPHSLTIGDFNGDNNMDIVVANSGFDNISIFLGYGNDSFASPMTHSTGVGSAPRMVTIGHFNNDTQLDLVVANFGTNNIMVLFGNGDASFSNQANIDTTPSHPLYVIVGDFNNDGYSDIAFSGHGTDSVGVILGFDNSTFRAPIYLFTGYDSLLYSIALSDLNQDGWLDIAVANYGTNNVGIFLGYKNESFTTQSIYATGINSRPYSIAIADLNNDNYPDVAVVNSNTDTIGIFFGYGDGTFLPLVLNHTGRNSNPTYIAIADFNNDNQSDIIFLKSENVTDNMVLLLGYGDGNFAVPITLTNDPRSAPSFVAVADFSNDNQLDIAVVNQQNHNIKILHGTKNQILRSETLLPTGKNFSSYGMTFISTGRQSHPLGIGTGDFNDDGHLDIAVGNNGAGSIGIFLGLGTGKFSKPTIHSTGENSFPSSITVADVNNDGRLDVVVTNAGGDNVGILFGYGHGEFSPQTIYSTGVDSVPISSSISDVNGDGQLDIIVSNHHADCVGVLLGYSNGQFSSPRTYFTGTSSDPMATVTGDFNNDGLLDIAVANYAGKNIGVFLGYGNGEFSPQVTYFAGSFSYPNSIVAGDFNRDDRLDIAVVNYYGQNVGVFLTYSSIDFSLQTIDFPDIYSGPTSIIAGDFNTDGQLDIAVANSHTNNIGVFLGNGAGEFLTEMPYLTTDDSDPMSLIDGDFNNDGISDIAVANCRINNVGVFLGKGSGEFLPQKTHFTGNDSYPISIALGDFNNDGRLDMAVANYHAHNVGVLLGNGNGDFSSQTIYSTGADSSPVSVVASDLNSDGILDIAVANFHANNVGLFFGYGNGKFSLQTTYFTGSQSGPTSLIASDLNDDRRLDIVVANNRGNNVGVFLGTGSGKLSPQKTYFTGDDSHPTSVVAGDFNRDGRPDIAVANYRTNNIAVFLGCRIGELSEPPFVFTSSNSGPKSIVARDFNNDGRLDIVAANYWTNNTDILLGYQSLQFSSQKTYLTGSNSRPVSVAVADFNNDGDLDIAVTYYNTGYVGVFLHNDDNEFSPEMKYPTGSESYPTQIIIADFNNDTRLDIAVANCGTNNIGIFLGYGNGTFTPQTDHFTGADSCPISVTAADFNNDGHLDFAVANYQTNNIGIFFATGGGEFLSSHTYSTGEKSGPKAIIAHDFNNDGRLDIAVVNNQTKNIVIFLAASRDEFALQTRFSIGNDFNPTSIVAGDFNHDGRLDIAVTNYNTNKVNVLIGNGNGVFLLQGTYESGSDSGPSSIVVGDLNNDGRLDIVVTNYRSNEVGVFLGYGSGKFSPQMTYFIRSRSGPSSAVIADVNGDGQFDIVVANYAANTISIIFGHRTREFSNAISVIDSVKFSPTCVVVDDFNKDGQLDIVVSNSDSDAIDIFLGSDRNKFSPVKSCSTGLHSNPVAVVTGDFNKDGRLDIAVANYGTDNVGVLLGYGNGELSPQTSYFTGNGSGPVSVGVGDLNNDGVLDMAVANYRTNNVGILIGQSSGVFLPQKTVFTGVNSSPHSLIVTDLNNDGRLDIAVANYGTNNVAILIGYGNGEFSSRGMYSTGANSGTYSIAAGDLNNDGRVDIAVANYRTDNIGIFVQYHDGELSSQKTYPTGDGSTPTCVMLNDFNNDGRLDIVVANYGTDNVGIFLGLGNGKFLDQKSYFAGTGSKPVWLFAGDLSNNGRLDLVVATYGTRKVSVFHGFATSEFAPQTTYSTGARSRPYSLALGDFNNDGEHDIASANELSGSVGIFLGRGNGRFSEQTIYLLGSDIQPYTLAVGDFNKDNRLDIVVANRDTNNIASLLGSGTGTFPFITSSSKNSLCSTLVAVADLNSDGQLDIATANYDTDTVSVLLGRGNGDFENASIFSTGEGSSPSAIVVSDFNKDGRLDIAVANFDSNNVGIFLGFNHGQFSPLITYPIDDGANPISLAVGDFNNDTRMDIVVANFGAKNLVIFIGDDNGSFPSRRIYPTVSNFAPLQIAIADLNNDGRLDITAVGCCIDSVAVLFGSNNGSFESWKRFSMGARTYYVSLALGDFNNDGNIDIVVVNSKSEEEHVLILLSKSDGNFSEHAKYLTEINSNLCSVVVGNFNNDGQLDIAVANNGSRTVEVFLGYGDGTFANQISYPTSDNSNPISLAVGDFDNDNLNDLAIANYATHILGIFLGSIDTNFIDKSTLFTGSAASPETLVLGDFTKDGQLDIVIGNGGTHDIVMFFNNGNGNFSMHTTYRVDSTFYPTSIVASDFNSDKQLDVAITHSAADAVVLLHGEENGTFTNSTVFSTGFNSRPQSMAVGDFNNDNKTDIVITHSGTGSIGLLLKIDNGALESSKTYSTEANSKPHGLAVADFDNDHRLDIVVANNGNGNIGLFFQLDNGTFCKQQIFSIGSDNFPTWVGFGDFNGDKYLDIITSNNISPAPVIVLLNNGDRSFQLKKTHELNATYMGAVGDLNNDGHLDVVFSQSSQYSVAVLLGHGDGTFRDATFFSVCGYCNPLSIIVADFNNDTRLDIAVTTPNEQRVDIFLGYGNGTFSSGTSYPLFGYGSPISIIAGDFNKDGRLDIAVSINIGYNLAILFGNGDGTFQPTTVYSIGNSTMRQGINTGDFNNDGQLDIVIANAGSSNLGIILGHVNGTFFREITYPTGNSSYPFCIGLGDFNNDGRLDVAVSNMLSDNIAVFLGYANEDFTVTAAEPIGNSSQPVSVAVGDFNNDTCLDAVVVDRANNEIVILHGSGYGTFFGQTAYSTGAGSSPSWVVVDDFNHDQYLDIAVVNSGTDSVGIFLGYDDGIFSMPIMSTTGNFSSPRSFTVGHFNNDTHLDIAVANFGTNNVCLFYGHGNGSFTRIVCRTSGYDSRPYAVASGDVNGDNKTDVVIANKGSSTIEILTEVCSYPSQDKAVLCLFCTK